MTECIFCKIVKGKIPCYKIYEDEKCLAFLDIADDAIGHTLVIPKKHYENIFDVSDDDYFKLMIAVKKISKHYKNDCGFSGVNIINANGIDAQQSVFHLHFHIIPREKDDQMDIWPELSKKKCNFSDIQKKLELK